MVFLEVILPFSESVYPSAWWVGGRPGPTATSQWENMPFTVKFSLMMAHHLSLTFNCVQPIEGSDMQLIIFQSLQWKHPHSRLFLLVLACVFGKKLNFVRWSVNIIGLTEFLRLTLGDYKVQNYKIGCKNYVLRNFSDMLSSSILHW